MWRNAAVNADLLPSQLFRDGPLERFFVNECVIDNGV